MKKLVKNTLPEQHTKYDFKCFGPSAIHDGEFDDVMLCDMGCFNQDGIDNNKFYHGAVVQSVLTNDWYVYFEFGRVGQSNPAFQFYHCNSKSEAQQCFAKQLHKKNDKRGEWVLSPALHKQVLRAKKNKDCYLVRPQAMRNTGLPDAKTIGINVSQIQVCTDDKTQQLLHSLQVGSISYTKTSIGSGAIPTIDAIQEAKQICDHATIICNKLKDPKKYLRSKELAELSNLLYGRIPKHKPRYNKNKSDQENKLLWLLTPDNIQQWLQDIDVFENAVNSQSYDTSIDLPFKLSYLDKQTELYKYISHFFNNATRNRHSYIDNVKLINIWQIHKDSEIHQLNNYQQSIHVDHRAEKPLHQPQQRLDVQSYNLYDKSNTCLLFHGTRSVNVGSILNNSLKLPKELSSDKITGAMFGSGLYFADDYKKSIGYTSYDGSYWASGRGKIAGRGCFMFIADVVLGNTYIPRRSGNHKPDGYHSIFGKAGVSGIQNNEFVVFTSQAVSLKYLLEFN